MRVVTHDDFRQVYVHEPAAAPGRIESVMDAIRSEVEFEEVVTAGFDDICAVHTQAHVEGVTQRGLYKIAALSAGGAIQAANIALSEPCFALTRPPGHHASADYAWGFCYFNNMAIALENLRRNRKINTAYVLDFDMHFGDGTVSILKEKGYVAIHNPDVDDRKEYLREVEAHLSNAKADIIGVSAGFDNHVLDWGGVLLTEDYQAIGRMIHQVCRKLQIGCFALLEGGYNHQVLGQNVLAFLRGVQGR